MNNWQDWVVGVLVVLCIARVIYGIFRFFRRTRENQNPCDSCVSGCELKDMIDKKRGECDVKKKSTKKNCCGQLVVSKFVLPLQPQTRNNGSLDEWLSQRSAKPCTAVRIRQEPHEALSDVFWKGFSLLLIENGTTLVLQNMISGWCFEERLFFIPRFLLFFRFVYSGSSQHIGNILQFRYS